VPTAMQKLADAQDTADRPLPPELDEEPGAAARADADHDVPFHT
jgi:hypothetical protein